MAIMAIAGKSEYVFEYLSNNRTMNIANIISTIGVITQHRTSFLLEIHSFESFHIKNMTIHSIKINTNNQIMSIIESMTQYILNDKKTKESKLHIILAITDFFREILSQYFIIIASIIVTKVSQMITYRVPSHIINGKTNHSNGRVIVVGIIHHKRSFLFEI
jgi:hypothetical protein